MSNSLTATVGRKCRPARAQFVRVTFVNREFQYKKTTPGWTSKAFETTRARSDEARTTAFIHSPVNFEELMPANEVPTIHDAVSPGGCDRPFFSELKRPTQAKAGEEIGRRWRCHVHGQF
jgi:hypothetical protein